MVSCRLIGFYFLSVVHAPWLWWVVFNITCRTPPFRLSCTLILWLDLWQWQKKKKVLSSIDCFTIPIFLRETRKRKTIRKRSWTKYKKTTGTRWNGYRGALRHCRCPPRGFKPSSVQDFQKNITLLLSLLGHSVDVVSLGKAIYISHASHEYLGHNRQCVR